MKNVIIQGFGEYYPPFIAGNNVIADLLGPGNPWAKRYQRMEKVFGVERRYFTTLFTDNGLPQNSINEESLAVLAARTAMNDAKCDNGDIGLVVCVSGTAQASLSKFAGNVHRELGLSADVPFMHISEACAGFTSGVSLIVSLMKGDYNGLSSNGKKVIFVASNCASRLANRELYTEVDAVPSLIVFGDGAAAVIFALEESEIERGVVSTVQFVDTTYENRLISICSSKDAPSGPYAFKIEGGNVGRFYLDCMEMVIRSLYEKCPWAIDASYFLLHQPQEERTLLLLDRLGISHEKAPLIVKETGNIGSVFVPSLLTRLYRAGKLISDAVIVAASIGDGNKVSAFCYRV